MEETMRRFIRPKDNPDSKPDPLVVGILVTCLGILSELAKHELYSNVLYEVHGYSPMARPYWVVCWLVAALVSMFAVKYLRS